MKNKIIGSMLMLPSLVMIGYSAYTSINIYQLAVVTLIVLSFGHGLNMLLEDE